MKKYLKNVETHIENELAEVAVTATFDVRLVKYRSNVEIRLLELKWLGT